MNQEIEEEKMFFFVALFRLSGFVSERSKHMSNVFADLFESDCIVRSMRCDLADCCRPIRDRWIFTNKITTNLYYVRPRSSVRCAANHLNK